MAALWVATGTAANALALAALCPPHGAIVCHRDAHIQNDECGAPEFYTHGAKLLLGEGEGAKLTPETVTALLERCRDDVHQVQPAALSITNATEYGLVYTPEETAALGALCRERGPRLPPRRRPLRQCGGAARLRAGRPDLARRRRRAELRLRQEWRHVGRGADLLRSGSRRRPCYRRKRAGHLLSKGRYLAAQILAMLEDDLWLRNARAANEAAARLAAAAGPERLVAPGRGERDVPEGQRRRRRAALRGQGFDFYDWAPGRGAAGDELGQRPRRMSTRSPPRSARCEPPMREARSRPRRARRS